MNLSDKLLVIANWLESQDNELLVEAEQVDNCLDTVALSLTYAADTLRDAAQEVAGFAEVAPSVITPEALDEMAAIATAFAESDDELLQKQASVLDELLLSISAPKNYIFNFKKAQDDKLDEIKKKYKNPGKEIKEVAKAAEQLEAITKSPIYKEYRPLEAPMDTRTCPDHPGAQMARIDDKVYQCSLDHKTYDFNEGFTTLNGNKVPGGSIANQTPKYNETGVQMFDSRQDRLGIPK